MNKEKVGLTKRFSIRIPVELHEWLKEKSDNTKGSDCYISMNDYIAKAVKEYKEKCSSSQ